jgi:dipeptidyl aminopeptidase/acylaminoacyl peptidase
VKRPTFALLLLIFALAACTLPAGSRDTEISLQDQVSTSVAATEFAMQMAGPTESGQLEADQPATSQPDAEAPEGETSALLPHTLYYLNAADNEHYQVWFISPDGTTNTRVTSEPEGVAEYSVSPTDGRVAFINNNQLVIINAAGDQRQVLVDGSDTIAETDEYFYTQKINGLSWSPDGLRLAYGRNGLHIYHFDTQVDEQILVNEIEQQESGFLFPRALYSPNQWSPDGNQLLVNISYYEAGTLGVYTLGSSEVLKLGEGIVCCQPAWTPDSRSILVASPFLGYVESGLWRFETTSGAQTELIPATSPDNTLNFAGWPVVLESGDLRYFYTNTPSFPDGDVPLLLVQSASDGITGRTILRPENWLNYEVLWAADGVLAVAVQPVTGEAAGWPRTGPIVVIPPSTDLVIPLGINGYHLQWGP